MRDIQCAVGVSICMDTDTGKRHALHSLPPIPCIPPLLPLVRCVTRCVPFSSMCGCVDLHGNLSFVCVSLGSCDFQWQQLWCTPTSLHRARNEFKGGPATGRVSVRHKCALRATSNIQCTGNRSLVVAAMMAAVLLAGQLYLVPRRLGGSVLPRWCLGTGSLPRCVMYNIMYRWLPGIPMVWQRLHALVV
jgi:hypothetical protein